MSPTENTGNKQRGRPFQKGKSGNPKGKPKGKRNKATMMAEALLDGQTEQLIQKAIEMALEGDTVALRICLDRILPPRRDRPIRLTLPPMQSAQDTVTAMSHIIEAATTGQIDPYQAQNLAALVENQRKAVETLDLEQRIAALEKTELPHGP